MSLSNPCTPLISALSNKISQTLDPLIPIGSRCAIVDFPNYANVGDSAIWLGQIAYLKKRRANIIYTCEHSSYSKSQLNLCLGEKGLIIINGGGNFGDLWPKHQAFREQLINDFPNHKIIQFPQSIHFEDEDNLTRCRKLFRQHQNFLLCVRDHASFKITQESLGISAYLCPDMAFCLGPLERPTPIKPVSWQSRLDKEAIGNTHLKTFENLTPFDWLTEDMKNLRQNERRFSKLMNKLGLAIPPFNSFHLGLYNRLAKNRVYRGIKLLSEGEIVVTNRLHGYIMCLLLGIPHYVSDNNYGKLSEFHQAWTANNPLTHWCNSEVEALSRAFKELRHTS